MTEQTNVPDQEPSDPLPGKLLDRRKKPEGVVPKQSQAYVIAGLAVMILLAVMFSKQHPKPAAKPVTTAATPAPELNERKIADLKEGLNTAQRESEQAAHLANGMMAGSPNGLAGTNNIAAQQAGAQPLPAQDQHRDAIADAERELAFKARFASNLVSEMSAAGGGKPERDATPVAGESRSSAPPAIVQSMDRLARNLRDLRTLVDDLTDRGVVVKFLKENLVFTNEANSTAKLMLNIMGAVAEFEREMLLERQREGIALAKAEGKYRGGKFKLKAVQVADLRKRATAGENKAALAREFNISRQSLYSYLQPDSAVQTA